MNYQMPNDLLNKGRYGEDVIIGVVDTGIWPESRSFSDEGYGPVPSRWRGVCQVGQGWDLNNCSRKIIGARFYTVGHDEEELKKSDYLSPRGAHGHGTHTASTAAGSVVEGASFHGLAAGVARGGAPHARIAVYKVLWRGASTDAALLAAIDDAIHDGVDVLSLSLGGSRDNSFGALHAVQKGMTVVYAAGNDGPGVRVRPVSRMRPTANERAGSGRWCVGPSWQRGRASAGHGARMQGRGGDEAVMWARDVG